MIIRIRIKIKQKREGREKGSDEEGSHLKQKEWSGKPFLRGHMEAET